MIIHSMGLNHLILLFWLALLTHCQKKEALPEPEESHPHSSVPMSASAQGDFQKTIPQESPSVDFVPTVTILSASVLTKPQIEFQIDECGPYTTLVLFEGIESFSKKGMQFSCPAEGKKWIYPLQTRGDGKRTVFVFGEMQTGQPRRYFGKFLVTLDRSPPQVSFKPHLSQIEPGQDLEVSWTVTEPDFDTKKGFSLEYSIFREEKWMPIAEIPVTDRILENRSFTYHWSVPRLHNLHIELRLSGQDLAQNAFWIKSAPLLVHRSSRGLASSPGRSRSSRCPENFVSVQGEFCVSKYEMKAEQLQAPFGLVANGCGLSDRSCQFGERLDPSIHKAVSVPQGTPWVNISRNEAVQKCREMGEGYSLISNMQWMRVAREIERTPLNWRLSAIGRTELNMGHTQNGVGAFVSNGSLEVSDKEDSWNGTTPSGKVIDDWLLKRTHFLSNGEEIWDFGGNVWEWVLDFFPLEFVPETSPQCFDNWSCWFSYGEAKPFLQGPGAVLNREQFAPLYYNLLDYQVGGRFFPDNPSGSPKAGRALLRGGKWNSGRYGGIYTAFLYRLTGDSASSEAGFRCIYLTAQTKEPER